MNSKLKISVDVDGTTIIQEKEEDRFLWNEVNRRFEPNPNICAELINFLQRIVCDEHIELYIITRRYGTERGSRRQVEELAALLSVPLERIHFLSHDWKYKKIKELGIQIHIDDDCLEDIPYIHQHTDCKTIFVGDKYWEYKFKDLIAELIEL